MRVVIDDNEIVKYNRLLVWQGVCDILCEKMSYIGQIIHRHRHIYTVAHMVIYEKMIMGMII